MTTELTEAQILMLVQAFGAYKPSLDPEWPPFITREECHKLYRLLLGAKSITIVSGRN